VNISQTTLRIGAVLGTIGAIVVLAASAQAATSKPAGMSQPEYRALMIRSEGLNKLYANAVTRLSPQQFRSEALNKLYGNAVTRLSPQQFKELYQAGANRMAPQEFAALLARSEALNRRYGLNRTSQPTKVVEQPTGSGNGFDWGYFGIGAAAMLGLLLLSAWLLKGAYFGRKIGVRPRPVT
jgi:hypothetical protein